MTLIKMILIKPTYVAPAIDQMENISPEFAARDHCQRGCNQSCDRQCQNSCNGGCYV